MAQAESHHTLSAEDENFYKVSLLVLDLIPNQLRKYFKELWDANYPDYPWLDTSDCGKRFLQNERKLDRNVCLKINLGDRAKWDATTLIDALLFSSHNLIPKGSAIFQAIDRLRVLRNTNFAHLNCAKIGTSEYQKIFNNIQANFITLNWATNGITDIEQRAIGQVEVAKLWKLMQEEKGVMNALEERMQNVEAAIGKMKL